MFKRRFRVVIHVFTLVALLIAFTPTTVFAQETPITHLVEPGDTLFRIAVRHDVDINVLAQTNGITDLSKIFSGQELVIPGSVAPDLYTGEEVVNALVASAPQVHVIKRGETFNEIAQQYGLTPDQLLRSNNISDPNSIYTGQRLNVWASNTSAVEPAVPEPSVTHVVQRGEYLSQIAKDYGVGWSILAQANNLVTPDRLFTGQELVIPGGVRQNNTARADLGIVPVQNNGPGATITTGKQIVVDLGDSRIYAYEDGILKNSIVVSTGLPDTPTVLGDFNIYWKLDSQRMTGPGYDLPGVPWVMYFYQGYAIHGTYWHNNFGQPMSHGCVNLPIDASAWFYQFGQVGTPVHVQG